VLRFLFGHLNLLVLFMFVLSVPVLAASAWFRHLRKKKPFPAWVRWGLTGALLFELLCLGYARLIEPTWLEVTEQKIALPGLGGTLRLVQLSDLHLDDDVEHQDRVLAAVEAARPDLVALTGDYLNDPTNESLLERFVARLIEIAGPEAVFAVSGNFEVEVPADQLLARSGVILLDGTVATFTKNGAALQLAGLRMRFDFEDLDRQVDELARQIEPGVPAVLLYHAPDPAEAPSIDSFDLVLTGHTHGGQVRLPLYGAFITLARHGRKYQAGMYELGSKTRLYVNRGIGVEPPPAPRLRFFCRPEIAVFELSPT
jgi:hypothetical protein